MINLKEDDSAREACGLFGIFGYDKVFPIIYSGLFSLQHRGQESAGITVSDGISVRSVKGLGLVSNIFSKKARDSFEGHLGIGHVRYSTTGSPRTKNIQPLVAECYDGIWAIAHNGNLVNALSLRQAYQKTGAIFQTGTDSEVLIHLLADPEYRSQPDRIARVLKQLKGAFSFLLMTKDSIMAVRDPFGFKPLSIGKLKDAFIFASETCAFAGLGAETIRDVMPGELVIVDKNGLHSSMFFKQQPEQYSQCIFEHVYFARPDSIVFGENVHEVRKSFGMKLAGELPVEADIVIAVPDSGNSAALGFSVASGIPLDHGFIRNHYVGRTFIMPEPDVRAHQVDMKLASVQTVVNGKRVVVVDDSIIRGTTCKSRISSLRDAGADEIHMRISCPPIRYPCFFGIDFTTKDELIATNKKIDEIGKYIGADSLGYLSLESMMGAVKDPNHYCTACFTGRYPIDISGVLCKDGFEISGPEEEIL